MWGKIVEKFERYPSQIAVAKEFLRLGISVKDGKAYCGNNIYMGDVLILNPGSATGVWGGGNASLIPSAMRVDVEGRNVIVRLCLDGEIEVFEFEL